MLNLGKPLHVLRLVAALIVFQAAAFAHADIYFPKFFSPAELPNTGFVLLNADPTIATVNFYLFGAGGAPPLLQTDSIQIPPHGQLAKLGSELFPTASAGGWVAAITDTEGMQAFWLNYDAGITFLDGAEAGQFETTGPDQIIPLVAGDTELNVVNLSGIAGNATIRLFGERGELTPSIARQIPIFGVLQAKVAALFPSVDMTQARYVRIRTPGSPIGSAALIKGFQVPVESAVVNGENAGTRTELTFPHVVNGALTGANYTTTIGVTNLSSAPQTVTLTFNPDDSRPMVVTRNLSGNGAVRETAASLFGLSTGFVTGWIEVSGTLPITGFSAYSDSVAGGLAVVPAGAAQKDLFFSHIADGPPQWQTGLALLNASDAIAMVDVYAVNPSGGLIGSTTITIEPGKKIAKLVHELIPQTRGVNGGYLYVRTTNNVALYGLELFYTADLKVLSNVAAGTLIRGVKFTPPTP